MRAAEREVRELFRAMDPEGEGVVDLVKIQRMLTSPRPRGLPSRTPRAKAKPTMPRASPTPSMPARPGPRNPSPRQGSKAPETTPMARTLPVSQDEFVSRGLSISEVELLVGRCEAAVQAEWAARHSAVELVAQQQRQVEEAEVEAASAASELVRCDRWWRQRLQAEENQRLEETVAAGLREWVLGSELWEAESVLARMQLRQARTIVRW